MSQIYGIFALFLVLSSTSLCAGEVTRSIPIQTDEIYLRTVTTEDIEEMKAEGECPCFYNKLRKVGYSRQNKFWFITCLSGIENKIKDSLNQIDQAKLFSKIRGAKKGYANDSDLSFFVKIDTKTEETLEKTLEAHGGKIFGIWDYIEGHENYSLNLKQAPDGLFDLVLEDLSSATYEWDD